MQEAFPLRCQGEPVGGFISNCVHLFILSFPLPMQYVVSCVELQPIPVYAKSMTERHSCDVALALPVLACLLFVSVLLIGSWCVTHQTEVGAPEASAPQLWVPGLRYQKWKLFLLTYHETLFEFL